MRVGDRWFRTIWVEDDGVTVSVIDQTALPGRLSVIQIQSCGEMADAIRRMRVRGAPLIGVAAAFGVALALRADASDAGLARAAATLGDTRPTAINLRWALDRMVGHLSGLTPADRAAAGYRYAAQLADDDVATCRTIGEYGEPLLRALWERIGRGRPVNVLTHCNAGWLATVDWGTALAPIYLAHERGVPIHVWVDETRPRNQGLLTAWELAGHGVPHTVIADNAGGHLMQKGRVDCCLVGTDRTTRQGDVANKIGTYLKALAAFDTRVPFYVAVPSSSVDWRGSEGAQIPIEERSGAELGFGAEVPVANPAFDVTPARLVTGLLTERGLTAASTEGLARLFPERTHGG